MMAELEIILRKIIMATYNNLQFCLASNIERNLCESADQILLLQGFSMYMSMFSIRTAEVL